jgi:phosphatidate cytidylyltransferase
VLLGSGWFILLLPILAVAGDLLESATKRSLGIKDFANYIPQTGGLLDRVDSWLPAFALAGWVLI